MVGRLTENRPIIGAKSDRDSLSGIVTCYSCRLGCNPATRSVKCHGQPLMPKLLQSALSVRNSCALQLLAITWQSHVSLQVVKNARYTYSVQPGVSLGYNRAEDLNIYHTSREVVFILVDTVSRGGNLLLDIGPRADGTIPVIMEERLTQMGDWLKINGEAIYGTKPWKNTRQWAAGEVPKIEYNKEYSSAYDVTKRIEKSADGKASIEAFFTSKGNDVYAILPQWPDHRLVIKDVSAAKSINLLGSSTPWCRGRAGLEMVVVGPRFRRSA
ncbi:MAG: hypothetical protein DMG96_28775 [Acidobacteria bacterium]|nr:MAG: hypothetical protein DMG96_28775 [Acidobacteriota bacterium]